MKLDFSRKICLYLGDDIKPYANYDVNFTVIDDLKKKCVDLLKGRKALMSDIDAVVELTFYMNVLFRCCMKMNDFKGLNTKTIIERLGDEIERALKLIIS